MASATGSAVGASNRGTEPTNRDALDENVTFVEAAPDSGFHYPYYVYAPPAFRDEAVPILVQPNNTGTATDDFEKHRENAEQLVRSSLGRNVSEELSIPLLVPAFPRPQTSPVSGLHYVHQLDRDTLGISEGELARVDLQLLRMTEHAKRTVLADSDHAFTERLMLNGFSASGNFVDRFAVIHADRVLSVTAGGINGMTVLPLAEADGKLLRYHVGIGDLEDLVGESADLDALDEVNQFFYMGEDDTNDTIPHDDAWTDDDLLQTAREVYGEDMITERFPRSQEAYWQAGVEAQFRVYEDVGHSPRKATEDVVEFHRRSLEDEGVAEFGQDLVASAAIERSGTAPDIGDPIQFDATGSESGLEEVLAYLWDFDDGETAVGDVVEHAYSDPGTYTVTLTVVTRSGTKATAVEEVVVEDADSELELAVTVTPDAPVATEPVEFDASDSRAVGAEIRAYTWEFGDSETGAGEVVSHSFATAGEYAVTVEAVTNDGRQASTETTVTVSEQQSTFAVVNTDLNDSTLPLDEMVVVTATVENAGERDGTTELQFLVGDETVDSTTVLIPAGETETVTFTNEFDDPGEYELAIGSASAGTVTVRSDATPTQATTDNRTDTPSGWVIRVPGFGALTALAGIGSGISYLAYGEKTDD